MNLTGTTLGQYRIVDHLGRGGMADVYKAYHDGLAVYRAIKVVRSELVTEGDFKARFSTEAKAVAKLRHPNIVQVQDFCAEDGRYYMVMEYVEGKNLKECVLEDGPIRPIERAANMIGQLASALHYAHQQGIIHRDIKPQNIIIDPKGDPVLTDFGIAKLTEAHTQLTQTGMSIGTPAYMAPEQALGNRDVGPAADIYSLTVVLYEALTGKVPFDADTPLATMLKAMHDPLPLPREVCGEISESLQRVILKGMARKPEDRYATALEFKSALEEAIKAGDAMHTTVLLGEPQGSGDLTAELPASGKRKSKWRLAIAASVLLLLVAGVAWLYMPAVKLDRTAEQSGKVIRNKSSDDKQTKTMAEPGDAKQPRMATRPVDDKAADLKVAGNLSGEKPATLEVGSIKADTIAADTLLIGEQDEGAATTRKTASPPETPVKDAAQDNAKSSDLIAVAAAKEAATLRDESDTQLATSAAQKPSITTAALSVNEIISGSIEQAGQKYIYTFDEYAGENIYFDDKRSGAQQPTYRLTAPDGRTTVFTSNKDSGPWELPQNGTYTLEISASDSAAATDNIDFEFVLWRLFPAVIDDGQLTLNRYTKNSTKFPGQKVIYQFSASEGQRVYFDEQHNGKQLTDYRLIAPDRRTKVFETNKDVGPLTLPQSGIYRLEIDPTDDNTVEFAFVLRKQ